jgi:hypothetical protein
MGRFITGAIIGFVGVAFVKCLRDCTVIEKEVSEDGLRFRYKASFKK